MFLQHRRVLDDSGEEGCTGAHEAYIVVNGAAMVQALRVTKAWHDGNCIAVLTLLVRYSTRGKSHPLHFGHVVHKQGQ